MAFSVSSIKAVQTAACSSRLINIYVGSLTAGAVEDDLVIYRGINRNTVNAFAEVVVTYISSRNTRPSSGFAAEIGPHVNVDGIPALIIGEVQGIGLAVAALSGLCGSGCYCCGCNSSGNDRRFSRIRVVNAGHLLTYVILDSHVSKVTLDKGSVDDGNKAITVYVASEQLLFGEINEFD